jgi:hypothetical protein
VYLVSTGCDDRGLPTVFTGQATPIAEATAAIRRDVYERRSRAARRRAAAVGKADEA